MTLPPWKSDDPAEWEALISFVIAELEAEDDLIAHQFADAFLEASHDPQFALKARDQLEAERLAKAHGGGIVWAEDKAPRGKPGHKGPFARAVRDVPRIRAIFRKHWPDKTRRTKPPSAEQIAARRWGLSDKEATKLHKAVQRP